MMATTNMVKYYENGNYKIINFPLRVVQMMVTTNMENENYNSTFKPKAQMDSALQSWQWY